jgi:hypothetical protein
MKEFFRDKNLLALYPAEDSGFPMRFYPLKAHFRSVQLLNYVAACHNEGVEPVERRILSLIEEEKIDIVLCYPFASDYHLTPEFFRELRGKARLVFWFADDSSYFESYDRYYAQAADAVITSDFYAKCAYERLEIPAVVCEELTSSNKFHPVDVPQDTDVCFIGDMRKRGRRNYIEALRAAGIEVKVFGQGSDSGYLPAEKFAEQVCRSRINLNFSQISPPDWRNSEEPLLNLVRQNTGRPREIALTGAFCLTEYSPGLGQMFKPGEQTDFFRDADELVEKVRFYLANPARREELARAAHLHALEFYKDESFIPRLLDGLGTLLKARPRAQAEGLYLSSAFKAREVNCLTFTVLSLLRRGRASAALSLLPRLFSRGPAAFLTGFPAGLLRALALLRRGL